MDFHPYELYTQTHTQKYSYLNTENSKRKEVWRGIDFFTTFDKYYFALKRKKTRETFFAFKTEENCHDAQNLRHSCGEIWPIRALETVTLGRFCASRQFSAVLNAKMFVFLQNSRVLSIF